MSLLPNVTASTIAKAKQVWGESIEKYGKPVVLKNGDESLQKTVQAFTKRPKILGQWDRTEQSYDQEKYMLLVKADDLQGDYSPEKFMRAFWEGEDHVFLSVTAVELGSTIFGYRILVKG